MRKLTAAAAAFFAVVLIAVAALAADAGYTVRGEGVSIDPAGKTVVINTAEGEKTVVFQEGVRGFTDLKPGMSVEMTCIDMEGRSCAKDVRVISVAEATKPTQTFEGEGKFCAKRITVIPPSEAGAPVQEFTGEIVSIDPAGKSVVIKTATEEKT